VAGGVLRHERPEALLPAQSHDDALRGSHREIEADDRGGADGVGKLTEDLSADNWIPLGGFAFNSKHAGEEPRVLRPPLEGSEREALEDARTSEDGEGEEASETKDEL
jgi:hypothetical protein